MRPAEGTAGNDAGQGKAKKKTAERWRLETKGAAGHEMIARVPVRFFDDDAFALETLSPAQSTHDDDTTMKPATKTKVQAVFMVTKPDGSAQTVAVPAVELPVEDYPLEKAFAHLAAQAAERVHRKPVHHGHD